jgi:hypothetical protein
MHDWHMPSSLFMGALVATDGSGFKVTGAEDSIARVTAEIAKVREEEALANAKQLAHMPRSPRKTKSTADHSGSRIVGKHNNDADSCGTAGTPCSSLDSPVPHRGFQGGG